MLVVEHGRRSARLAIGVDDLLEEAPPRIHVLFLLVVRIVAVFADQQHPVHRQLVAASGERLGDRRPQIESVMRRHRGAQVTFGMLVEIHRDHAGPRAMRRDAQ